jgi:uncharacterized protein with HEPN domain
MKAITTLRNYAQYRKDNGANVQHLLDAIDELEAYIHALEYHQQTENKHRVLLAKLIIKYFYQLDLGVLADTAEKSIKQIALDFASNEVTLTLENWEIFKDLMLDQAKKIEAAAFSTADEFAAITL